MNNKKRERGKNYTEKDRSELLEIVEKYSGTVECKKTDNISIKKKQNVWKTICEEYNTVSTTGKRDSVQLKNLYESMKKKAKKDLANDKMETYKTGGGTFTPTLDATSDRLISMLKNNISDLNNSYDSSAIQTTESNEIRMPESSSNLRNIIEIPVDNIIQQEIINIGSVDEIFGANNVCDSVLESDQITGSNGTPIKNKDSNRAKSRKNGRTTDEDRKQEMHDIKFEILKVRKEQAEIKKTRELLMNEKLILEIEEKRIDIELKKKLLN